MKLVSNEKPEKNTVELVIEVTAEEFEPALERSYRKNVARMNVPGFRKGKAPRKMLERMYGEGVFFEDAVNYSYSEAYNAAIDEAGIEPVDKADIEILDVSAQGYQFKAKITVRPEVKLGKYKGLTAKQPVPSVEDGEVEEEIERMRERNASIQTVERAAKTGDTVEFDYEGFVDDVPFDGGKDEHAKLVLGSGRFIPGFEEQLVGKSAGEEFDVNVTFPEEYHAEHLAGKAAVFKCTLHEVKESLKPDLDDEFAKDVSEFDTLDELRASIRARIMDTRARDAEHEYEDALIGQVVDGMEADIPEVMIENRLNEILGDLSYRLAGQRLDLKTYLAITGSSVEQLKEEHRPTAERQVKASLAFDAIAAAEKIEVSDEELQAEYSRLAELYNMDVDRIKSSLNEKEVRRDLSSLKASKLIIDTAEKTIDN
ncbi:MAG: trigger factor [Oscillospiraceae bacterium]|jgi:trigger factor|nr:trigger factor [Oscillospiraceae bacterium]